MEVTSGEEGGDSLGVEHRVRVDSGYLLDPVCQVELAVELKIK